MPLVAASVGIVRFCIMGSALTGTVTHWLAGMLAANAVGTIGISKVSIVAIKILATTLRILIDIMVSPYWWYCSFILKFI